MFHVYEPVPPFYESLRNVYAGNNRVVIHPVGLGKARQIRLKKTAVAGLGTFVMSNNDKNTKDFFLLDIVDVEDVLRDVTEIPSSVIDLLTVNCEGCEWELFPLITKRGLWHRFKTVQFSMHVYDGSSRNLTRLYCDIRQQLSHTHRCIFGKDQPWEWERWILHSL
jgi:hypothetical protein